MFITKNETLMSYA